MTIIRRFPERTVSCRGPGVSMQQSTLYIVSTPIGNLQDMSPRAIETLKGVDVIAAEDTRHTTRLLRHFGINTPLTALHEHNEREAVGQLVRRLREGQSVAQVSDAGTPLVSDPGYHLVRAAQEAGIAVSVIPGPSATLAALAVSGLPTDRFVFEGFLPPKPGARRRRLQALAEEPRTLVFFEAPHRVSDSLADMADCFGAEREGVLARELTKTFETVRRAPLGELAAWVEGDSNQQKGEIVLLVHGAPERSSEIDPEAERILGLLAAELPLKQAAALAARITGLKKNALYDFALHHLGE